MARKGDEYEKMKQKLTVSDISGMKLQLIKKGKRGKLAIKGVLA